MRLWLKVLLVLGMTLAILVPLTMVRGVIGERQMYRAQAVASVARSYAGAQAFAGPVLVVPYTETVEVEEKRRQGQVARKVRCDGSEGAGRSFRTTLDVDGKLTPGDAPAAVCTRCACTSGRPGAGGLRRPHPGRCRIRRCRAGSAGPG